MRRHAPKLVELAGLAAVTYGCWLLAAWLGWIIGGLVAVAVALDLEGVDG
jgi:hypothetical protein